MHQPDHYRPIEGNADEGQEYRGDGHDRGNEPQARPNVIPVPDKKHLHDNRTSFTRLSGLEQHNSSGATEIPVGVVWWPGLPVPFRWTLAPAIRAFAHSQGARFTFVTPLGFLRRSITAGNSSERLKSWKDHSLFP
jgi:hypothetical protein